MRIRPESHDSEMQRCGQITCDYSIADDGAFGLLTEVENHSIVALCIPGNERRVYYIKCYSLIDT